MRFILLALLATPSVIAADAPKAPLMAGAATSNITPELGGEVVGGFSPYPCTHIHDELHARCLVLDDGKTKLALVVCDLLGLHRSVSLKAREFIEKETGIPAANVLISGTHTHSAVNALGGSPRGFFSDFELTDFQKFVARRIADGVRRAANLLRPAEIAFGTVDVPEHVHIRRWFLKEGSMPPNPFGKIDKVKMNPGAGNPALVKPAGEPDLTVSFIALREPGGRLISVYSAYSLHYVGGVSGAEISADYYGYFCEALKRLQAGGSDDPPFVAMMANGTSGDANNINFRNPQPGKKPYEQTDPLKCPLCSGLLRPIAVVETATEIDAVLTPLGLGRSHDRPFAHGPPVPEFTVLVAADSGTAYPIDPPPFESRLPYPQPRDGPIRYRAEVMAPGEDFDQTRFELPPAPKVAPAATGQGFLFDDDCSQPASADAEPVFWADGAGQPGPAETFVQADALESV